MTLSDTDLQYQFWRIEDRLLRMKRLPDALERW